MKKMIYIFFVILLVFLVLIVVFVPFHFSSGHSISSSKKLQIIAHRGASGIAPENTMPAFEAAVAAKADYIELDVHLSKDNVVIVMHDYSVDRTTNGTGLIAELDSDYIETLDAGEKFGAQFKGTKVPFLEEVIQTINGRTKLLIEIKEKHGTNTGIEKEIVKLIKKHQAQEWCVVQSFNDESIKEVHLLFPEIEIHKLFLLKFRFIPYVFDGRFTYFSFKKYNYVNSFNMHQLFVNNSFLKKIHAQKKKMNVYGCSDKNSCDIKKMQLLDGIITNYPGDYSY
jgi:glycerophosphoryl diester phosphodiesterase